MVMVHVKLAFMYQTMPEMKYVSGVASIGGLTMTKQEFLNLSGFTPHAVSGDQFKRLLIVYRASNTDKEAFCKRVTKLYFIMTKKAFDRVLDSIPLKAKIAAVEDNDYYGINEILDQEADDQMEILISCLEKQVTSY
jgi:hypothetical protein